MSEQLTQRPDDRREVVERGTEVADVAEGAEVTKNDQEKEKVRTETREKTKELRKQMDIQQAEKKLDTAAGDEEGKESTTPAPAAKPASRMDAAINGIVGGIDKAGKILAPFIERISAFVENVRESLRASFGKTAGMLKKMGINVPEWLIATVPGVEQLTAVLAKGNRTLSPAPTDAQTMRELMALHQRAETAAGAPYPLEQFFNDAVIKLPATMSAATMTDIREKAERVAEQKEKEAEERQKHSPAMPATPAPPATT